jgi:hypothetical protein
MRRADKPQGKTRFRKCMTCDGHALSFCNECARMLRGYARGDRSTAAAKVAAMVAADPDEALRLTMGRLEWRCARPWLNQGRVHVLLDAADPFGYTVEPNDVPALVGRLMAINVSGRRGSSRVRIRATIASSARGLFAANGAA